MGFIITSKKIFLSLAKRKLKLKFNKSVTHLFKIQITFSQEHCEYKRISIKSLTFQ